MSKLFTGSLCLTDMIEKAKQKHSAFTKADNGKIYVSFIMWENDEPDKFKNTLSFQLSSKKEMRETEGKHYIGNGKPAEQKPAEPVAGNEDALNYTGDNIETRPAATTAQATEVADDLPF